MQARPSEEQWDFNSYKYWTWNWNVGFIYLDKAEIKYTAENVSKARKLK